MPKPTFFNLPEEKRARIVELAIDEFATHPYAQASLSRIVARAGIAKGSVYQYFDNKLDLYRWLLFEEVGPRKRAYVENPPNEKDPPKGFYERLESQCIAALAFLRDYPRLARLASRLFEPAADGELRPLHEETRRAARKWLAGELTRAQATGEVRKGIDVDLGGLMLSHILGMGLTDALLDALDTDLDTLLREPERGAALSPEALRRIVHGVIDLVRYGVGAEGPDRAR